MLLWGTKNATELYSVASTLKKPLLGSYSAGAGDTLRSLTRLLIE